MNSYEIWGWITVVSFWATGTAWLAELHVRKGLSLGRAYLAVLLGELLTALCLTGIALGIFLIMVGAWVR
jgi:hypothetical protein